MKAIGTRINKNTFPRSPMDRYFCAKLPFSRPKITLLNGIPFVTHSEQPHQVFIYLENVDEFSCGQIWSQLRA